MTTWRALFLAEFRLLLRDRAQLFFTLIFPLLFILIFGFIMADVGEVTARLGLVVGPGADGELLATVLEESGARSVERFAQAPALREAVIEQRIDFGVEWNGDTLRFIYHANRIAENATFRQIARSAEDSFELRRQGLHPLLLTEREDVGANRDLGWFNLMVPGIIAFSILSAGLFAVSGHVTAMKERRTLTRLLVTPMPTVALLVAIAAVRLVIVFASTLITLFVAWGAFRLQFTIDWLRYVALVISSTLGMMGLGTVIALVVRRASSAANLANILAMVMLFLSGIYFPIEFLPTALRRFSQGLPLRHMAEAMRAATGVFEMSATRFWIIVLVFAAAAVALFPVLARYVVRVERR
ncbi:MAG: ABC transporter permease [Candidatus Bipolaricaulota bacterium]|nr:MAG: ABC transporter permease [Candidatus Bipolaricaulota bacterium]